MRDFFVKEITIVGPGLIGSSIGLSAKEKKIVGRIIGIDSNKSNLADAINIGSIDCGYNKIDENISNSDIIFICTPVKSITRIFQKLLPYVKKKAIISDVGSVKNIFNKSHYKLIENHCDLIPGHPIAGTEFSGASNSKKDMFENKWCVLTPMSSSKKSLQIIKKFWIKLGMNISNMTPEEHDKIVSITSHLPHLIAFAIVETSVKFDPKVKNKLINLSAGGFRDFTRIASSDPKMWTDIFLENKKNIIKTLEIFTKDLNTFKNLIKKNDDKKISQLIKKSKNVRKRIVSLKQT